MGSVVGKAMDDNMKKQQEFMLRNQLIMMERQIHMQNQMRERQMAMGIARSRDMFVWFSGFYTVALLGCIRMYSMTRKPTGLVPLIPLTFILGYQGDMAFGNKLERCRAEAERIMANEREKLELPTGLPSVEAIDSARRESKDAIRIGKFELAL